MMKHLKLDKLHVAAGLLVLACCAAPNLSFAIRTIGKMITGQITSMPTGSQIELDHQLYRVKTGTFAQHSLRTFHMGQVVDVELDSPASAKSGEVISIALHPGS